MVEKLEPYWDEKNRDPETGRFAPAWKVPGHPHPLENQYTITLIELADAIVRGASICHAEIPDLRVLIDAVQGHRDALLVKVDGDKKRIGVFDQRGDQVDQPPTKIILFGGEIYLCNCSGNSINCCLELCTHFALETEFREASFTAITVFKDCRFSATTDFGSACFSTPAFFCESQFEENANFSNTHFESVTNFGSVQFTERSSFIETRFSSNVFFNRTHFSVADFGESRFEAEANFSEARFHAEVSFENANFAKKTQFHDSRFTDKADFFGAHFAAQADFSIARFAAGAFFNKVHFAADAKFGNIIFGHVAEFTSATFTGEADFASSKFKFRADFYKSHWESETTFDNAHFFAMVNFKEAIFQGWTNIQNVNFDAGCEFSDAFISNPMSFLKAEFMDTLDLSKTTIEHRLIFTKGANSDAKFVGNARLKLNQIVVRAGAAIEISAGQLGKMQKHGHFIWGEDSDDAGELALARDDYNRLRDIFRGQPSADEQEEICNFRYLDLKRRARWAKTTNSWHQWCWEYIVDSWDRLIQRNALGYMIRTRRIMASGGFLILFCALVYYFLGYDSIVPNIVPDGYHLGLGNAFYFSLVTFTSLGYGDLHPVGLMKVVSSLEALLGLTLMALFTVSWARKMIR